MWASQGRAVPRKLRLEYPGAMYQERVKPQVGFSSSPWNTTDLSYHRAFPLERPFGVLAAAVIAVHHYKG